MKKSAIRPPARPPAKRKPVSNAQRMRAYRQRMRAQGLKLVQMWAYDTKSPEFIAEAKRQSEALAKHDPAGDEVMKEYESLYDALPAYEWD